MITRFFQIAVLAACAGAFGFTSTSAEAKRPESKVEVAPATTPEAFAEQATAVRAAMRGNGRYSLISNSDRNAVEANLDKIASLLEQRGSVANLTDREQVVVNNAQEQANALLTENDGDRLVCRYEKRTGSHFREKVCNTVSELARMRDDNQREFRRITPPPPAQVGG
jgi:hypothetical protein